MATEVELRVLAQEIPHYMGSIVNGKPLAILAIVQMVGVIRITVQFPVLISQQSEHV
jgi:hypothetical protein